MLSAAYPGPPYWTQQVCPCFSPTLPALAQSYALFNCQSADAKVDLTAA